MVFDSVVALPKVIKGELEFQEKDSTSLVGYTDILLKFISDFPENLFKN